MAIQAISQYGSHEMSQAARVATKTMIASPLSRTRPSATSHRAHELRRPLIVAIGASGLSDQDTSTFAHSGALRSVGILVSLHPWPALVGAYSDATRACVDYSGSAKGSGTGPRPSYRDENERDVVLGCFARVQSLWQAFGSQVVCM